MRRRVIASAAHYVYDVTLHPRLNSHSANFRPAPGDCVAVTQRSNVDLIQTARVKARVPTSDDLMLFISGRIRKQNLEQKTIQLGFRQRICSFVFDWVL